jgi:MFS family permease
VPPRPRVFYGWYIVGVCFLAQLMSWGLMFYSLTFFVEPMTSDLGWTVAQFSLVYTLNSLLFGFGLPLFGDYVDRHGVRKLMFAGSLITGLGLMSVAYISHLLLFYLMLGVVVTFGMMLMAGFSSVAISNWFVARRGRTLAIMSMGSSVGGLTLAPLAAYLIGAFGWRIVWLVFGFAVIATVALPALLILKRRPEDLGLYPDGASHPPDHAVPGRVVERKILWTRRQAVRTPTFWLLIGGFSLNYLAVGALLVHLAPFLGTKSFSAGQVAFGVLLFALGALAVKPLVGILLERFPPYLVATAATVLSLLGLLILIVGQGLVLYAGILVYALAFGGSFPIEEVMWASSFGRWTLGRIRSVAFPFTTVLGSAGPVIGGIAYDATASYIAAFWIFAVAYVGSAILLFLARPPTPPIVELTPVPARVTRVQRVRRLAWSPQNRGVVPAVALTAVLATLLSFNLFSLRNGRRS